MKPLLTTLAAFCFTFTVLKAQKPIIPKTNHVNFGVFAGLNYTNSFVNNRFFKPQASFLAGVDLQYHLTNRSSLHLQPSWTQVADAQSQLNQGILSLGTFKLPLVYRYYVSPKRNGLFVQTGLSYNYATNSSFRMQRDIVCITAPCPNTGPDTPSSNKSAVSGIAGIGYSIELKKISIPITLQYERYFSNYEFSANLYPAPFFPSDVEPTRVKFESFALTTGINF